MRPVVGVLFLIVAPGCTGPDEGPEPPDFAQTLEIPDGWDGYVEIHLNERKTAAWTWDASAVISNSWDLRCPEAGIGDSGGQLDTSGGGSTTSPENACRLYLFWLNAEGPVDVTVRITGEGVVGRWGTEPE